MIEINVDNQDNNVIIIIELTTQAARQYYSSSESGIDDCLHRGRSLDIVLRVCYRNEVILLFLHSVDQVKFVITQVSSRDRLPTSNSFHKHTKYHCTLLF